MSTGIHGRVSAHARWAATLKTASKETTVDDPTTQLNYQIADMIADTFGRAVEDFDIDLADQIIAKVRREHGAAQFIPAITQSAEEFNAATNAFAALDIVDDEDARDTDEYKRYTHTGVVLASIVTAEIDLAKK
jgi:hypothetical protein